jgi:hypothetical protein
MTLAADMVTPQKFLETFTTETGIPSEHVAVPEVDMPKYSERDYTSATQWIKHITKILPTAKTLEDWMRTYGAKTIQKTLQAQ